MILDSPSILVSLFETLDFETYSIGTEDKKFNMTLKTHDFD